jgi:fructosamine-3-kinase
MFEAESEGLIELAKADAVLVPLPVCTGLLEQSSFIVMDDLLLCNSGSMSEFAHQLVKMHRYCPPADRPQKFGWSRDNTIGSTLQDNTLSDNWITFWNTQRLGYQLTLAKKRGVSQSLLDKAERIQADLETFFRGYEPVASLLHGDLWSGNFSFTQSGEPVIFDPAVYYGDREADIAMTELFGGFSRDFYEEYNRNWPLDGNYHLRKDLYNLYHILNHFNMFGGSYGSQAEQICGRLLSEIR